MKSLFVGALSLMTFTNAFAGEFVDRNRYQRTANLQGEGRTFAEAEADARSAMPVGWFEDRNYSPTIECKFWKEAPDGSFCDLSDTNEKVRMTIHIVQAPE